MNALIALLALGHAAWGEVPEPLPAEPAPSEQAAADASRPFTVASGYELLWNDPFVRRSGPTLSASATVRPWLGVELRGGLYPLVGDLDWRPLTSQLVEELGVSPDLSRVRGRGDVAVTLTPLRAPLTFRGGEFESALGLRLGLGGVWTEDDLEISSAVGDPAWESTASQVHPAVTYGVVGELNLGRAGVRIRMDRTDYVEIVGGDVTENKQTSWFGLENVWYFGGGAD